MAQCRRLHVTRVPSSSLLGVQWVKEPVPLIPYYGIVETATLKLNESETPHFVELVLDQIQKLPSSVSWYIAKSSEEPSTWILMQTVYTELSTETTLSPSPHYASPSSNVSDNIKSQEETPTVFNEKKQTLVSRGAEQFYFRTKSFEQLLPTFLGKITSYITTPPVVEHSRLVISSSSPSSDAINCRRQFGTSDSDYRCYYTTIRENLCLKAYCEQKFIELCQNMQQTLSKIQEPISFVGLEVHQDLEFSIRGRNVYSLFYYFENEIELNAFKESNDWFEWKNSLLSLMEGPSTTSCFQAVFDTREFLFSNSSTETRTGTVDTVATPTDCANNLSPTSVLAQLAQNITRIKLAEAASAERVDAQKNFVKFPDGLGVINIDPRLKDYSDYFRKRYSRYIFKKDSLMKLPIKGKLPVCLKDFHAIYKHFGINRVSRTQWVIREWIPKAKQVFVIGEFNNWNRETDPMSLEPEYQYGADVWSATITGIQHRQKLKLHIVTENHGSHDRIPPSAAVVWKDLDSEIRNAIAWDGTEEPNGLYIFRNKKLRLPHAFKTYEVYIGLTPAVNRFGTYTAFRQQILPRVHILGYNAILLLGIVEHSMTSLGWHVTNFLAPTSQFGTEDELKELIDAAHGLDICVFFSVVHSHASPSKADGLAYLNGTDENYTRGGSTGIQRAWDSVLFDYEKPQVTRFLLSQLAKFVEEFKVDGFRFEGVTSMLYHHHAIGKDLTYSSNDDVGKFFSYDTDNEAAAYLMLANDFLHNTASVITIASEFSGMPTLTQSVELGGVGFDYLCSPNAANEWIKQLCNSDDINWSIESIVKALEDRPATEKVITFAENWNTSTRSRRPLLIAMFAWESLHTHAVGGVAPHVTELAAGLARLGHNVHVFVRATGSTSAHNVHYNVHYHECPFRLNPDFVAEMMDMCNSFVWHLGETEAFLKRKFDVCHAHDWLAAKAMVMAKHSGHTCIQSIHSTEFGRCGNKSYGGESKRISDIEREACHIADRVICVSGVLASEVCNLYGIHLQKIKVIYNGINAQHFDGFEDAAPIKAKYGLSPLEPMFLFVGRLAAQKGADLLVEAMPFILKFRGDAKFLIVGDGYCKTDLINRVRQLRIENSCKFLGAQHGAALKSLFKACDAVVVPSRNEPFGIVVLEAWSAYKPVVATTCGGPRDFVSPNVDGVLVDPNPHSIAWGCCEILKNFDHARWMGQRGRVKAAFNFSWDEIAKLTESVYFEQLNKHDAPYSEIGELGDCSLAFRLAGPTMYNHMGIFDYNEIIQRCLALHKMIRLITSGLGAQGYLNFMGNEFGHPDYVDVPRGGNNFSFLHTNRRYDLPNDKQLKYKHFEFFDACLIRLENVLQWLSCTHQFVLIKNSTDKVIAFERGNYLFLANFHPTQSYESYEITHQLGEEFRVVLDSDEKRFGGSGRADLKHSTTFPTRRNSDGTQTIQVYLPNRTAMILASDKHKSEEMKSFFLKDLVFSISDVDKFVALF